MFRVIQNRSRIGKHWQVVSGDWREPSAMANIRTGRRWHTATVVAEYDRKGDADDHVSDLMYHCFSGVADG